MAQGGTLGTGVRMGYAAASPHVWTEISEVLEATPFQFSRDRVDTSIHGTTGLRRYIPGLSDVNDARALLLADFDRTTSPSHLGLRDLERAQTLIYLRIGIPVENDLTTTPYWVQEAQCRVSQWSPDTPIDDRKTIEVLFQFGGVDVYEFEDIANGSLFTF